MWKNQTLTLDQSRIKQINRCYIIGFNLTSSNIGFWVYNLINIPGEPKKIVSKFFFSALQLTCNIRQFRKFHFKIINDHRDFAFFVDPYKFDLYENLERTDVRNLSLILLVYLFLLDLCNVKASFARYSSYCELRNTALRSLLDNIVHYKFNDHRFIYRSKRHAQSGLSLTRKNVFCQTKISIQNNYEEKNWSAYKI